MSRTWDENRSAINQLWPVMQFTDEEKRLWHDDLCSKDQDTLYDAIRNVKRNKDSQYPQLKWVLDAYRDLEHAKRQTTKRHQYSEPEEAPCRVFINKAESLRYTQEFVAYIDAAEPRDFDEVKNRILDKLPKLESISAMRLLNYARKRLLGQEPQCGKVTRDGDVMPFLSADPLGDHQ